MHVSLRSAFLTGLACSGLLYLGGCRQHGDPFGVSSNSSSWNASKVEARQDLTEIPSPSKGIYLSIREGSQWQNPFLTVDRNMIRLRIYLADENASALDRGGMTRTTAARRQVVDVSLADLPRALSSLPDSAWPYGRVIAVGKGMETPQDRAQIRHNLEVTVHTLNDLGIVVDVWDGPE